ncbi:hypothetical protein TWF132_003403 [Orbilia oligospora]|nr:hypothetical protein TWF132_003403 [Orbilia oligospora]
MAAEITQTTTMFNCLLLSVLRRFKSNQLWNFIWLTDMHLTPTIVNELDARQNMLQGAWVFGPDDLESSGIIAGSLFKFLNTKVQLRDLHLGRIHDMDTVLNVFNNFDRMPNKLQRLTVQLQDSNFLERLLESPEVWGEFLQQNNSGLSQFFEPKFSWLTHLSLQEVDDVFFEGVRRIDHIFALGQLEELKFTFGRGRFSSTVKQMTGKCLRLKVFTYGVTQAKLLYPNFLCLCISYEILASSHKCKRHYVQYS